MSFKIRFAKKEDAPIVLEFIELLAEYEKLRHEVSATLNQIEKTLFGKNPYAQVIIGFENDIPVGFALFFFNYSTFLAKPGIYLEDLFVKKEYRSKGYGKNLLSFIAAIAVKNECGRLEWSVLDWNKQAIDFYLNLDAVAMDDWTTYRVSGKSLQKLAEMQF